MPACPVSAAKPLRSADRARSSIAPFAIEVDGKYRHCALTGLQDRHGSLELGIGIGDREYWGRGYGRDRRLLRFDSMLERGE
jgi:RimJ/RimL family protein N-acetyltransferase